MTSLRIAAAVVASIIAMLFTSVGVLGLLLYFAGRRVGLHMDVDLGAFRLEGWLLLATFSFLLILAAVLGARGARALSLRKDGSISRIRLSAICVALLVGSAVGFYMLGGIVVSD